MAGFNCKEISVANLDVVEVFAQFVVMVTIAPHTPYDCDDDRQHYANYDYFADSLIFHCSDCLGEPGIDDSAPRLRVRR